MTGTRGSDTLQGTGRDDVILTGAPGSDTLLGGAGTDALLAADGVRHNDIMAGGEGRDRCRGDRGDVKRSY